MIDEELLQELLAKASSLYNNGDYKGAIEAWNEVLDLARASAAANYREIEAKVDLENLADFLISNFYVGNIDWVGTRNNGYTFRSRTGLPDHKFRFLCWDGDNPIFRVFQCFWRFDLPDASLHHVYGQYSFAGTSNT